MTKERDREGGERMRVQKWGLGSPDLTPQFNVFDKFFGIEVLYHGRVSLKHVSNNHSCG